MSFPRHHDHLLTEAEYLAGEELSEQKHEYLNGVIYAMAGGTTEHSQLGARIVSSLMTRLRGRRCEPFNSDMRLRVQHGTDLRHYYPDTMIVCDPRRQATWQDAPSIIFEVLSDGTERVDQSEKWEAYQRITTLDAYVLVDSRRVEVQVWRRAGEEWRREMWRTLADTVELPTVECAVPLAEIYEGVVLAEPKRED